MQNVVLSLIIRPGMRAPAVSLLSLLCSAQSDQQNKQIFLSSSPDQLSDLMEVVSPRGYIYSVVPLAGDNS